jgi:hypothetical protein
MFTQISTLRKMTENGDNITRWIQNEAYPEAELPKHFSDLYRNNSLVTQLSINLNKLNSLLPLNVNSCSHLK